MKPRVVIVGAGFGGIEAAKALKSANADVVLVDRFNHHLFQPLLYQVATAGLSPGEIAVPIRAVFQRQKNLSVVWGELTEVDREKQRIHTTAGELPFDFLILATGSEYNYFGHDGWEKFAPKLKTLRDATRIRERILASFERAEESTSEQERRELLTFLFIGAGPTGVELAGAVAELARLTLAREYRRIDPRDARIVLIEAAPRILGAFPESLSRKAERDMQKLGVELMLNTPVEDIRDGEVTAAGRVLRSRNIVWTAGVKPTPVGSWLGTECDRGGRVVVTPDLTIPGTDNIYVVGDACGFTGPDGKPLPAIAPVAMQQGRYVGRRIAKRLRNEPPPAPFRYWDKGMLATIGRSKAVAVVGGVRLSGFIAWVTWLFVHLMYLVGFENRLLVFIQWCWYYLTFKRGARLITEASRVGP